jgi:hypothetical protein
MKNHTVSFVLQLSSSETILSFILSWLALPLFVLVLKLLTLKADDGDIHPSKQNIPFLLKR